MRKHTVALAMILLIASFAVAHPDDKKEKKDAPRKIEITGDAAKVRAALIKLELEDQYEIGDEQSHRITFKRFAKVGKITHAIAGDLYVLDVFTFTNEGDKVTIFAITQVCTERNQRDDCHTNSHPTIIERLDKLLASLKTNVEPK